MKDNVTYFEVQSRWCKDGLCRTWRLLAAVREEIEVMRGEAQAKGRTKTFRPILGIPVSQKYTSTNVISQYIEDNIKYGNYTISPKKTHVFDCWGKI